MYVCFKLIVYPVNGSFPGRIHSGERECNAQAQSLQASVDMPVQFASSAELKCDFAGFFPKRGGAGGLLMIW